MMSAASVFALSGCAALSTRIPDANTRLPAAYEAGSVSGAATLAPQSLDRWWTLYGDAQLNELIEQALVASPDAKSAMGRLREAQATRSEIFWGLLPQGSATGSAARQNTKTTYNPKGAAAGSSGSGASSGFFFTPSGDADAYQAAFNVSWELDLFGRDFAAVKIANADLAAARFDYEATRMSLAAAVGTALFQARGLAIQLDDAKENARIAHDLATVGKKKSDIGIATTADTARLEADAASADAQVDALDAQLKGATRSLLILIGRGGEASAALPIEAKADPAPAVPATAPSELLARRPDVREAEARVRSAAGHLHVDKLALLPTFTLQPGITYSKQSNSFYDLATRTTALGVGVSQPVLSIPKLLAEVRAQGARGEQAVAAYEKAVFDAYGDAEKGLTTLQSDERRVATLKDATDKARFAYDAARKGYGLGLADLTTLVQAEQGWRQTRAAYTTAATSALVDSVATFKALGGGWPASSEGKTRGNGAK